MYNKLMTYQHLGGHIGEMDIQSLPAHSSHKIVERTTQFVRPDKHRPSTQQVTQQATQQV